MKPFITPELTLAGKKAFLYQCEGVESKDLWSQMKNQQLIAYALPEGHTLQAAWEFAFIFASGLVLDFSSASTQAINWQEVGSLNIRLTDSNQAGVTISGNRRKAVNPPTRLTAAEKLIYEDEDVFVECGIVLFGEGDQQVVIAAGIPPGSVSVKATFSAGSSFEPQFPLAECSRQRL